MDALSWFKSVVLRARTTAAPLRADVATEDWADVPPLRPVAVVSRPPAPPAGEDQDWDAAIVRAHLQAASPRAPIPPPLPPVARALQRAPLAAAPPPGHASLQADARQARLNGLAWGGMKKPRRRASTPPRQR